MCIFLPRQFRERSESGNLHLEFCQMSYFTPTIAVDGVDRAGRWLTYILWPLRYRPIVSSFSFLLLGVLPIFSLVYRVAQNGTIFGTP